jgi:hypothetical protein
MGSAKSFIKGLAAGAVFAAHAKQLGKLSRSAYDKIVDTTVAEYRGVKALSESELTELKDELKMHWTDVQKILKK